MFRFRAWIKRTVSRPIVVTPEELRQLGQPLTALGAENVVQHQIDYNRVVGSDAADKNTPWLVDSVEEMCSPDALERLSAMIADTLEVDTKAVTIFHYALAGSKLPDMHEISDISIALKESHGVSSGIGFNTKDHAEVILWCERYLKVVRRRDWTGVDTEAFKDAMGEIELEIRRSIDEVKLTHNETMMLLEYRRAKGLTE